MRKIDNEKLEKLSGGKIIETKDLESKMHTKRKLDIKPHLCKLPSVYQGPFVVKLSNPNLK